MSFKTYSTIKRRLEDVDPGDFGIPGEPDPPFPTMLDRFLDSTRTGEGRLVLNRYSGWVEMEYRRLRGLCLPLLNELTEQARFHTHRRMFLERLGWDPDPSQLDKRVLIALFRVVEPLVAGKDKTGIERTWKELEVGGEFEKYLQAAFKREEILLNRKDPLVRQFDVDQAEIEGIKFDLAGVGDEEEGEEMPWESYQEVLEALGDERGSE